MSRGVDDFEGFFEQHYGPTLRAISLAIGDSQRAEDLTQEAFARAYRRWSTVSKLERPVAWVYVVALNAERKRWRREVDRSEPESPAIDSPDPAGGVLTRIVVRDALDRLPPRQRAAVVLRYLSDLAVARFVLSLHRANLHALSAENVDLREGAEIGRASCRERVLRLV